MEGYSPEDSPWPPRPTNSTKTHRSELNARYGKLRSEITKSSGSGNASDAECSSNPESLTTDGINTSNTRIERIRKRMTQEQSESANTTKAALQGVYDRTGNGRRNRERVQFKWKITGDGMFFQPFWVEAEDIGSAIAMAKDILAGSDSAHGNAWDYESSGYYEPTRSKRFYGTVDTHIKSVTREDW